MADVTLTYKGDTIAELSDSGNKKLETAGKYCEADILLEYVKSGGSPGYALLASDTYTQAANTNTMTIPVDYSGTPIAVFVEAQTFSNEGNQTAAWFSFKPTFSDAAALFPLVEQCKIANANGYLSNRAITGTPCSFDNNSIVVHQYSGSIPIRANTYNWYIWGIA